MWARAAGRARPGADGSAVFGRRGRRAIDVAAPRPDAPFVPVAHRQLPLMRPFKRLFTLRWTRCLVGWAACAAGGAVALVLGGLATSSSGCVGTSTNEVVGGNETDAAACWPASALTADESGAAGCTPRSSSSVPVCTSPSDTSVLADGAIVTADGAPATPTCSDACGVSEYALSCDNASPDTALHCTIVPVARPGGGTLYCCPCVGVGASP
jgi:hypothetical protein